MAVSWLAAEETHRFKVDFAWTALVLPVAGFALTAIIRAFTAEDRIRRKCADQIVAVKDAAFSNDIRPALAAIIVKIYAYLPEEVAKTIVKSRDYLPGQPGDPELEATRILGYRQTSFSTDFTSLENHYGTIHRANSVHGRLVTHYQRRGAAMAVFLAAWIYIGCYLMLPNIRFPNALTIAFIGVLSASAGWAACEWWGSNRENNLLSVMARAANQASTGQTS